MGLYGLLEACILFVNSLAILHEERFLQKVGWGADQNTGGFGEEPGVKQQIINLVKAVRTVMRIPLIFFNVFTVFCLLLFGWMILFWFFYLTIFFDVTCMLFFQESFCFIEPIYLNCFLLMLFVLKYKYFQLYLLNFFTVSCFVRQNSLFKY